MAQLRSSVEVEALRKLEILLGEKGYVIFPLKRWKCRGEFLAAKRDNAQLSAVLCRTYAGQVRMQFLEGKRHMLRSDRDNISTWMKGRLRFHSKPFNPTRRGANRMWYEFISRGELEGYL